jgi:hypothetical protein
VASSASPAYSPSRPVTIGYARVRETIRSMSNRRYFKMATPMQTGRASTVAAPAMPPATPRIPCLEPPLESRLWRARRQRAHRRSSTPGSAHPHRAKRYAWAFPETLRQNMGLFPLAIWLWTSALLDRLRANAC